MQISLFIKRFFMSLPFLINLFFIVFLGKSPFLINRVISKVRLSLREKIFSIQEPLAFYRIHDSNMTTKKIDLNISELEKWLLKNIKKKQFKNYDFSNIRKIIQTLKIKKFCISGNILKFFLEVFKRPINLLNLKYIIFLILPKKMIDRF